MIERWTKRRRRRLDTEIHQINQLIARKQRQRDRLPGEIYLLEAMRTWLHIRRNEER